MTLDDRMQEELRMLRHRAYGPAADIDSDPAALARLAELEDALRADDAAPSPAAEDPRPAAEPASEATVADATAPDPESEPDSASPPRRRHARRWVAALWPVSVIAAIVVGAVSYAAAVPLVSRDAGAVQVATLRPDPGFEWPEIMGAMPEGALVFQEFYGLTTIYTSEGFWGNDEGCMIVLVTERVRNDADAYDGPMLYGCGAASFAPTVQVPVEAEVSEELTARFPAGSGLQFVFAGDRVGVFSDAP